MDLASAFVEVKVLSIVSDVSDTWMFSGEKNILSRLPFRGFSDPCPYKWVCTSSKKCVDWNYCFVWEFAQKITNATLKIDTFFSYLVTPVFHQQCLYLTGLYDFFYKQPLCLCTEREPMPCVLWKLQWSVAYYKRSDLAVVVTVADLMEKTLLSSRLNVGISWIFILNQTLR